MHDQKIYNDFGFTSSNPLLIGLLFILTYVFAPFNTLLKYASIKLSRKHEFEADAFSKVVLGSICGVGFFLIRDYLFRKLVTGKN
jgi:Zn-dependent protease with chaperone function